MEPGNPSCAACGKTQGEVRKLITAEGGPTLCDGCIAAYAELLKQAFEDDQAAAGASSVLAAEDMALALIDALETSRAEQVERDLQDAMERRSRKLRLVQAEDAVLNAASEPVSRAEPEEESESEAGSGGGVGPFFGGAGDEHDGDDADDEDDEPAGSGSFFEEPEPSPGKLASVETQEFGRSPEEEPSSAGSAEEAPVQAETPRPKVRHCPWCTGTLEPVPEDGASETSFRCESCGRRFDIQLS